MFRGTMPPRDLKEAGARQKRFIEQPSSTGIQILSGPKPIAQYCDAVIAVSEKRSLKTLSFGTTGLIHSAH
jgi:hypothetical protein